MPLRTRKEHIKKEIKREAIRRRLLRVGRPRGAPPRLPKKAKEIVFRALRNFEQHRLRTSLMDFIETNSAIKEKFDTYVKEIKKRYGMFYEFSGHKLAKDLVSMFAIASLGMEGVLNQWIGNDDRKINFLNSLCKSIETFSKIVPRKVIVTKPTTKYEKKARNLIVGMLKDLRRIEIGLRKEAGLEDVRRTLNSEFALMENAMNLNEPHEIERFMRENAGKMGAFTKEYLRAKLEHIRTKNIIEAAPWWRKLSHSIKRFFREGLRTGLVGLGKLCINLVYPGIGFGLAAVMPFSVFGLLAWAATASLGATTWFYFSRKWVKRLNAYVPMKMANKEKFMSNLIERYHNLKEINNNVENKVKERFEKAKKALAARGALDSAKLAEKYGKMFQKEVKDKTLNLIDEITNMANELRSWNAIRAAALPESMNEILQMCNEMKNKINDMARENKYVEMYTVRVYMEALRNLLRDKFYYPYNTYRNPRSTQRDKRNALNAAKSYLGLNVVQISDYINAIKEWASKDAFEILGVI